MWPNQGPPMVPGYNPAYPSVPPAGVYPQGQYPGYPAGQYPVMGPVAPGAMPYNVPVITDERRVITDGRTVVTDGRAVLPDGRRVFTETVVTPGAAPGAPCVIIEDGRCHHGGISRVVDSLHKVHKKMKKAGKHRRYRHGECSGSSSSSSDSD